MHRRRTKVLAFFLVWLSLPALAMSRSGATPKVGSPKVGSPKVGSPKVGSPKVGSTGQGEGSTSGPSNVSGHEAGEGFVLGLDSNPDRRATKSSCASTAPVREYRIAAIAVDITLNRYLDHDPQGRMFVLEDDIGRVRAEERSNAAARTGHGEPAVSIGLQGDAIQPLTLRVVQGECLRLVLHNDLPGHERVSLHLHGTSLSVVGGGPAIATNPAAMIDPGQRVTYEWMVGRNEPEATHYFHSHGDDRTQTNHGLFGAVIVERRGATWSDPLTGRPLRTGWAAVINTPSGAFREFALYYHEIGNESYQPLDAKDQLIPLVDPITDAYRPDGVALNYRSEPFMNRLALGQKVTGRADESLQYSSYSFGDPATPIMRSYLGDPVKQRIIHAGTDLFHVHHVHGGAIRWLRQPDTEPSRIAVGLDKHPPLLPLASDRTDSQAIGPSETYDIENECGSGGCQQSAGDFMYHCHVTHHYFAGMWGLWRVYNTLQDGPSSTDELPPLRTLPDREAAVEPAVISTQLIGRTVDSYGLRTTIGPDQLGPWVEAQLPPRGVPRGYDAAVWDWTRDGTTYFGEPEATQSWPGYRSSSPGQRPVVRFDPRTGRLAYPLLRPHLAARPPFAPGHGPAPFLDPFRTGTDPPPPGANGPASVCPAGTQLHQLAINAISTPIPLSTRGDLVDPLGELFVLRHDEAAVRAGRQPAQPLAIRANAGQDCIDVVLRSELSDGGEDPWSKVSLHIHFVQFDVQGSDGVDAGFNYEQSVRPYALTGTTLTSLASAGAPAVSVASAATFQPGEQVGVGIDQDQSFEVRQITSIVGSSLFLDRPLAFSHGVGERVSTEFVRYRWYPDVQFGSAFFHDHTNVLSSGRHGLYGALISEPPGSTYTNPHTGAPVTSGPVADIHSTGKLSTDVTGSFRELVLALQDDNPITHVGRSTGSSFNLRVEPLDGRAQDPSLLFSSAPFDPETPVLDAYLGDPVALRAFVGASNDVHSLHVDGHWFRTEPYSATSPPVDTVNLGISERYDVVLPKAGGPQQLPGDYLYYSGQASNLREGDWGILRVHPGGDGGGLQPLPGHENIPAPSPGLCPADAPVRTFSLSAIDVGLPMLGGAPGKIFVTDADRADVAAGRVPPEPLVLHVNVGDCLRVHLTNATTEGPVSFHVDMLAADPAHGLGVAAGRDPQQALAPGASDTFMYYASPEVGPTTAMVRDFGDVLDNPALGLYGAIVVGPRGARYTDPVTGADVGTRSAWAADVHLPSGQAWRDFTLLFEDGDAGFSTHRMPYTPTVDGTVAINYTAAGQTAPLPRRLRAGAITSGLPATPLLQAYSGDPVQLHVLSPASEQPQVFTVEGHRWPVEPGRAGTNVVSATQLNGLDALTLDLQDGAGAPGLYEYGDHREPYREAGMWGLFEVLDPCGATAHPAAGHSATGRVVTALGRVVTALRPLGAGCTTASTVRPARLGLILAGLALGAVAGLWGLSRRREDWA